jgi:hypothetical protein
MAFAHESSLCHSLQHWRGTVDSQVVTANAPHGWRNDSVAGMCLWSFCCVLKDWKLGL